MRPSRVFRLIFRIFVLILSVSVTIVVTLGGLSAVTILTGFDTNFGMDYDDAEFNFEIDNSTYEIEDFSFALPFYINNTGYFDLDNLALSITLEMNYSHVDDPVPGVNTTRQVEIFGRYQNFGTIHKGTVGHFSFTGGMSNFINASLPDFTTEVDWYRQPSPILFFANIVISLDYTLGMHSLEIGITNLELGGI